ncbi:MAG: hypothetical protein HPY53_01625 [Brevinematales bacterium]|nr:hypothetical protein [Brevinematales bacterium]
MSINRLSSSVIKDDWFFWFFQYEDEWFENNNLSANQMRIFKIFLKDAGLIIDNKFSELAQILKNIGWDSATAWGIILTNLVFNNPQIRWYAENIQGSCTKNHLMNRLIWTEGESKVSAKQIVYMLWKLLEFLPLGRILNFGATQGDTVFRTECHIPDVKVVLYGLYKYAEMNDYYEFTVSYLYSAEQYFTPPQLFKIFRDDFMCIIRGLAAVHQDFIVDKFTHDLDSILLRSNKTSQDVLELLKSQI